MMAHTPKVLDVVTYEDRANPRTAYLVTAIRPTRWGTDFELENVETGATVYSDLRQGGWDFADDDGDEPAEFICGGCSVSNYQHMHPVVQGSGAA